MGDRNTISGHIQEAFYIGATERQTRWLLESNSRTINSLPIDDQWPFLTRRMFSFSPLNSTAQAGHASPTYRGRVIYFGGSFSSIYVWWHEWLEKFETLLRRLYWEHAVVVLVTEFVGQYVYRWDAPPGAIRFDGTAFPKPISDWSFTGEPRKFSMV